MKDKIIHELEEHIPFTIIASVSAIIITFIISQLTKFQYSEPIFESFHIAHLLVSAFATTTVYYKYKKSIPMSIFVGLTGAILIGTFSDAIFPYLSALVFNLHPHLHIPILEQPILLISVALIGTILGIFIKHNKLPHFLHVFLSTFASLFYLVSFTTMNNIGLWILATIIIFLVVLIPCCLSDIIYPLLFIKNKKHNHSHT